MHREYCIDDSIVGEMTPGYRPPAALKDENSPLRQALRTYFGRYKGLTTSLPVTQEGLGSEEPIYKDTSNGICV
jgi:hypothetical protein